MTIFELKILACIFMVIDHIKYAFQQTWNDATLYLGRIAFPIFVFCAVQGYIHTHDLIKYLKRIFIVAVISQIPYAFFGTLPLLNRINLNVMFTLLMGLCAIATYDKVDNKIVKTIIIARNSGNSSIRKNGLWSIWSYSNADNVYI